MKQTAKVLHPAVANSRATLVIDSVSQCQRCHKGKGCGLIVGAVGKPVELAVLTPHSLNKDQQVSIEIDDIGPRWLYVAAGAYGLPLAGLVVASVLAHITGAADAGVAAAALIGLVAGISIWRGLSAKLLDHLQIGLCVNSARIVSIDS